MIIQVNNKNVNVPDKELDNLMKTLDLSQDEALDLWLTDNDYVNNPEIEELTKKAKVNKTTQIHAGDKTKRAKTERKPTENPLKQQIIEDIYYFLLDRYPELNHNNINITNKTKLIEFSLQNRQFKLDLVEKRAKKV